MLPNWEKLTCRPFKACLLRRISWMPAYVIKKSRAGALREKLIGYHYWFCAYLGSLFSRVMDGIKAGRRLWGGGWLGKEEEGWEDYNAYSGERGGMGRGWGGRRHEKLIIFRLLIYCINVYWWCRRQFGECKANAFTMMREHCHNFLMLYAYWRIMYIRLIKFKI